MDSQSNTHLNSNPNSNPNQFNKKEAALTLGKLGEDLACGYLVNKGYKIIQRNYRKPWGEIDIIAKAPDRTLVFVEVKTMTGSGDNGIQPEDQLTQAKLEKLKRTACLYAGHYPEKVDDNRGWRIDLLALRLGSGQAVLGDDCDIKHYENIA